MNIYLRTYEYVLTYILIFTNVYMNIFLLHMNMNLRTYEHTYVHMNIFFVDIDECYETAYVCKNSGICTNYNGGFECECMKGFKGHTCEEGYYSNVTHKVSISYTLYILIYIYIYIYIY